MREPPPRDGWGTCPAPGCWHRITARQLRSVVRGMRLHVMDRHPELVPPSSASWVDGTIVWGYEPPVGYCPRQGCTYRVVMTHAEGTGVHTMRAHVREAHPGHELPSGASVRNGVIAWQYPVRDRGGPIVGLCPAARGCTFQYTVPRVRPALGAEALRVMRDHVQAQHPEVEPPSSWSVSGREFVWHYPEYRIERAGQQWSSGGISGREVDWAAIDDPTVEPLPTEQRIHRGEQIDREYVEYDGLRVERFSEPTGRAEQIHTMGSMAPITIPPAVDDRRLVAGLDAALDEALDGSTHDFQGGITHPDRCAVEVRLSTSPVRWGPCGRTEDEHPVTEEPAPSTYPRPATFPASLDLRPGGVSMERERARLARDEERRLRQIETDRMDAAEPEWEWQPNLEATVRADIERAQEAIRRVAGTIGEHPVLFGERMRVLADTARVAMASLRAFTAALPSGDNDEEVPSAETDRRP